MTDEHWMQQALTLAEQGRGWVEPNPLVGAVIVRDGIIVGSGFHAKFGGHHAEVAALAEAGENSRGATLYVTLEPCAHHGKTPPCTDAIRAAGIKRTVAAMADPFPEVAGRGFAQLRAAGVAVEIGVCEHDARRLNRPYLTLIEQGRPYVHLKWAMTLDGKIATRTGDSKWISGDGARQLVHQLRGRMDGIIVGAGTVRADDPRLTVRPPGPRTPARIVCSTKPELPAGCQLLRTASEAPIILATVCPADINGVEVLPLPDRDGRPDVRALLLELGRRRLTNVMVEGGSAIAGSFFDAGLIDEVHVFIAPRLAGGRAAPSPIGGAGIDKIAGALALSDMAVERIDDDIYVHGHLLPQAVGRKGAE